MTIDHIAREFADATQALEALVVSRAVEQVAAIANAMAASLRNGGKVLACGNGGSSADAMHFCEELTGRYRGDRPALAAIACTDPGHLTCTANDYGYEFVFSRWIEALGSKGDVLIALTTSGNSRNVLRAIEASGDKSMTRVALLGGDGGIVRGLCEHEIIVPGATADRIQELHMLLLHAMIGEIERQLGLA